MANGTMSVVSIKVRLEGASDLERKGRLPRRPVLLAPPFRVATYLDAPVLTLHTIQTPAAYDVLRRKGILVGDPALGDADFAEAYDWMRRQMAARLPTAGEGILWLWLKTNYRDLVGNARHARGEVLLTVRVPRERVLLSHFDDWHTVLNRGLEVPLLPGETFEEWSPRFDSAYDEWGLRADSYRDLPIEAWPPNLRAELEASWESIFDLSKREEPLYIQATVHALHASEVVRAVRIM